MPQRFGSARSPLRIPSAGLPRHTVAPLSEDEVNFCWRGLVEEGRLSVPKLQKFMLDVCGHHLTPVQARDLLNYMDADGDGRVGKDDFKNFMSTPSLAHTDVKNFMWTPKAKYREKHPLVLKRNSQLWEAVAASQAGADQPESVQTPSMKKELLGRSNTQASTISAASSPDDRRHEASSGESPKKGIGGGTTVARPPPRTPGSASAGRRDARAAMAKSRGKDNLGRASSRAAKRAERETAPQIANAPSSPRQSQAMLERSDGQAGVQASKPRVKLDPKTLAKIEVAISRYEQESWETFLKFESDFQRQLFGRPASDPHHMTMHDYHKMLTKWFPMASWCAPGTLRPGDSLATLEYLMRSERESRRIPESGQATTSAPTAGVGGVTQGGGGGAATENKVDAQEPRMTYRLWLDILAGKCRPKESSAPVSPKQQS